MIDVIAMKFAYADPPYLGCGKLYAEHHPNALDWDDPQTHFDLIDRLIAEYPDGWLLSCHEPSLHIMRGYALLGSRTGIWVKPFASFKPNVNPAYAWEPVIFCGGRPFTREDDTVRDWVSANITLKRGLTGAKPRDFCRWVISLMNAKPGDQFDDLFPGTGAFTAAWRDFAGLETPQLELEGYDPSAVRVTKSVEQVLREARALIADRKDWLQGVSGRDEHGREHLAGHRDSVQFCAYGALVHADGSGHITNPAGYSVFYDIVGYDGLIYFNDTHTHDEVLAAFDKAIELAARDKTSNAVTK